MRFMRRLYQLGNSLIEEIGFMNNVNPEQKRNKTSPIVPPVAKALNFTYRISICEFVTKITAKNFSMSMLTSLSFIPFIMQFENTLNQTYYSE